MEAEKEQRDFRTNKTLTERVAALEAKVDIGTPDRGAIASAEELEKRYYASQSTEQVRSGCEESILGERENFSARGQYVGPRTAYDEIGSRERFAEREKEQAWRNERASNGLRYFEAAGRAGEQTDEIPALESVLSRIYELSAVADSIGHSMCCLADRVVGPQPEEASGKGSVTANPDAVLDRINLALLHLDHQLSRIQQQHLRIHRI